MKIICPTGCLAAIFVDGEIQGVCGDTNNLIMEPLLNDLLGDADTVDFVSGDDLFLPNYHYSSVKVEVTDSDGQTNAHELTLRWVADYSRPNPVTQSQNE